MGVVGITSLDGDDDGAVLQWLALAVQGDSVIASHGGRELHQQPRAAGLLTDDCSHRLRNGDVA